MKYLDASNTNQVGDVGEFVVAYKAVSKDELDDFVQSQI